MRLIITVGTQFEDRYEEFLRCSVKVSDNARISEVLEQAKTHCASQVPVLSKPHKLEHLYLMHPETLQKLDEDKSVDDYDLGDGSIIRLMSAVR